MPSASQLDDRFGSSNDELIQEIDAKLSLSRFEAKIVAPCPPNLENKLADRYGPRLIWDVPP